MEKWYKKSYFRNLVDMHIPSGEQNLENFDPEHYAECMETAGVDTAYVYASNCLGLCLFPTEIGFRHSVTYKRDIFGETVAALKRRGIRVVGYLNSWCTEGARRHPDWQIVSSAGKRSGDDSRFGTLCLNSPYRSLFHRLVYEMVSKYDIDGLWVDMIGFFMPDCRCRWCREKYRNETGFDLPETIDWTDENYIRYIQFKFDTVSTYAQGITEAAHQAKPDISVSYQCASWSNSYACGLNNDYFATMDYVSGDFYADRDRTDVVCRLLPNLSNDSPFEYMISRAPDLCYHTAIKDKSEILLQAYTAFLCGGSFLFIDAIDPDGGLNIQLYRMMGEIRRELEPFFKTIDYEAQVLRDAAVYINFDSYTSRDAEQKPSCELSRYTGIVYDKLITLNKALSRAHIDYDILTEKNIDGLSRYKVIVLPDLYRMKESECEKFREFVKNGGRLFVSGSSSALSTDGKNRERFMLEDVMGVRYLEFADRSPVYMAPTDAGQEFFAHFSETYPAMFTEAAVTVEKASDSAEVLATVTYPFTDARNFHRFSSAISNPPGEKTDLPALVYNPYGEGACLYSFAPFSRSEAVCNYDIFAELMKRLIDEKGGMIFETEESEYLEHVVRHSKEKQHYTVSLLNYQNVKKIVPLYDVQFSLRLDVEPKKAYTNLGMDVAVEKRDGKLFVRLAKLEIYDVICIEY